MGPFRATNARRPRYGWVALTALMLAGLTLPAARPVHAGGSTLIVNVTNDTDDGDCNQANCTLREAINAANANINAQDTIAFDIPFTGVQTIHPLSELPSINGLTVIDGYTQDRARENTLKKGTNAKLLIEISGDLAPAGSDGLTINNSSTVRGLVINQFKQSGGNGGNGITTFVPAAGTEVVVEGNFVGTNPAGTQDLGNEGTGVDCRVSLCVRVGGNAPAQRNLISGNGGAGILASGGPTIAGNLIGTDKTGTADLGNDGNGVDWFIAATGGTLKKNVIAFNGANGTQVFCVQCLLTQNSIFDNGALGIELSNDGQTDNDIGNPPDTDAGPNDLQNYPELDTAKTSGKTTTIKGQLRSTPSTTFTIEFFSNNPGEDEGQKFIGKKRVTTNDDGIVNFTFKPKKKVADGRAITTTATDPGGNTSEFSVPETVT